MPPHVILLVQQTAIALQSVVRNCSPQNSEIDNSRITPLTASRNQCNDAVYLLLAPASRVLLTSVAHELVMNFQSEV